MLGKKGMGPFRQYLSLLVGYHLPIQYSLPPLPGPVAGHAMFTTKGNTEDIYGELCELLVAGGYYRAQITGLTPFDKIAGFVSPSLSLPPSMPIVCPKRCNQC